MNFKIALVLITGILLLASPSLAQQDTTGTVASTYKPAKAPRLDIIPMGGYVWTVSQSATYQASSGDVDIKDGGFYGLAVDIYAVPYMQIRLLYRRQDSQVTWKQFGTTEDLGDVAVEYWHVGAVKGFQKGKVKPFSALSLGGTRFAYDAGDNWYFSVLVSLGAKIYLNDRIGILGSGQMGISFTDAFAGIGTGGVSIGGTGITQFDLTAGLIITL